MRNIFLLLLLLISFYGWSQKPPISKLEVKNIKSEISQLVQNLELSNYRELSKIIKDQKDIDNLVVSFEKDFYTLVKEKEIIEGFYNLDTNQINGIVIFEGRYRYRNFTEKDKVIIQKWLHCFNKYDIYGFEKLYDEIVIHIKPNVVIIFSDIKNCKYSYLAVGKWSNPDNRGDLLMRLADDVLIATYRR